MLCYVMGTWCGLLCFINPILGNEIMCVCVCVCVCVHVGVCVCVYVKDRVLDMRDSFTLDSKTVYYIFIQYTVDYNQETCVTH